MLVSKLTNSPIAQLNVPLFQFALHENDVQKYNLKDHDVFHCGKLHYLYSNYNLSCNLISMKDIHEKYIYLVLDNVVDITCYMLYVL